MRQVVYFVHESVGKKYLLDMLKHVLEKLWSGTVLGQIRY